MSVSRSEPIAIIGMGCRFPGKVETPAGLWELAAAGRQEMGTVPADRWDAERLRAFQNPDEAARYGRGCFLHGDVWAWDPEALNVAPAEQRWVDPHAPGLGALTRRRDLLLAEQLQSDEGG